MWQVHAMMALDLARDRAAEARAMAWGDQFAGGQPSAARRALAWTLRSLSDVAHALSNVSASAARSIEGAG